MAVQPKHAVGVFDDLEKAKQTVDRLQQTGFPNDEIGIIGNVNDEHQPVSAPPQMQAAEHVVARAVPVGGTFGAIIGALVMLVIPGLGLVAELGWWFELVGGAVLGAAVGGILFALGGLGFFRPHGQLYAKELQRGRFIVTVSNDRRQQEALNVLGRQAVHAESD